MESIRQISKEDILLWPDGSWCLYENLDEYSWMSDDFEVIPFGSDRWVFIQEESA